MSESSDNYLKAIYVLSGRPEKEVSTSALAEKLRTKASSVTDMLSKLKDRGLIRYERYKGASLTKKGERSAVSIVRRHRLWEVFLVEKLKFNWDEVHQLAEQLEHVESDELTDRLDSFLGHPKFDPHGDPIPDKNGILPKTEGLQALDSLHIGQKAKLIAVSDSSDDFLRHLQNLGISLETIMAVTHVHEFDRSVDLVIQKKKLTLSHKSSQNMLVQIIR